MSDKIHISFEDACKLAFSFSETGDKRNSLEIINEVIKQFETIEKEIRDLKSEFDRVLKNHLRESIQAGVYLSPELLL